MDGYRVVVGGEQVGKGNISHLAPEANDPEGFGVTGSKCKAGHTPDLQLLLDSSL